jgi:hypothetical protein
VIELEVHPRCVICGKEATHYAVRSGASWFDRIPILAWVSRLQVMPRRHAIVEDWHGQLHYCATCQSDAKSVLERAHAQLRADMSRFAHQQQQEVAALNHGELDHILKRQFEVVLTRIELAGTIQAVVTRPQLEAPQQDTVHVMPVATTGPEATD